VGKRLLARRVKWNVWMKLTHYSVMKENKGVFLGAMRRWFMDVPSTLMDLWEQTQELNRK
jgi:hypothetical protein